MAERASGPRTRGLPVAPVVEPVRLPVSRIACAEFAAPPGGDGWVRQLGAAERGVRATTTTRSRRTLGAELGPGAEMEEGPVVTFGFTDNKYVGAAATCRAMRPSPSRRRGDAEADGVQPVWEEKWESKGCIAATPVSRYCVEDDGVDARRPQASATEDMGRQVLAFVEVDQTQLDYAKSSMKSPISANLESKASATKDMGRQLLAFVERYNV
ncbi:hypothetical protein ZWY2020_051501 [Hordeum vulgare]|nr:hypothetical protein ZWY2020_051501 [Hordeum vulgare]